MNSDWKQQFDVRIWRRCQRSYRQIDAKVAFETTLNVSSQSVEKVFDMSTEGEYPHCSRVGANWHKAPSYAKVASPVLCTTLNKAIWRYYWWWRRPLPCRAGVCILLAFPIQTTKVWEKSSQFKRLQQWHGVEHTPPVNFLTGWLVSLKIFLNEAKMQWSQKCIIVM